MSDDPPHPFRDNPFAGAHQIDAFIESVRALNMTLVRAEERAAREHRENLFVLQRIAEHTQNLPALMDLLVTKRTNGHGHEPQETEDARRER